MSQRLEFPIEYSFDPEAQVIIATVPSLNHISSFGKDFAEAENNIIEAVLAYIESLQKDELPITQDCASTTGTLLAIELVL
ncbi:MAG: type II toxin-antitoxin system HicB family antitoxin [Cyanobacteriota bacterium]|nr:type II toxin-antitoxin system HicB family antitoxin [Cyanobacteriota bacterium]